MMGGTEPVIKEIKSKERDQFMKIIHLTEPAASAERGFQVIEVIRKVQGAKTPTCLFYNVDF